MLAYAPAIAVYQPKSAGQILGYDINLGEDGPKIIEINTNAGGALLNAKLARAQSTCCGQFAGLLPCGRDLVRDFVAMFREEWGLARGDAPFSCIAIVDEAPATQYLAP